MKLLPAPYYDHATHWKCSSIPNLITLKAKEYNGGEEGGFFKQLEFKTQS